MGDPMAEAVQPTPCIGWSLRRREDYKFLTGKGRYVDDIKLSGTLHLAILRSQHAHAVITGMNLSPALGAPGVRLALGGADLIGKIGNIKPNWVIPGTVVPDRPVMGVDSVRFVRECVALVVAGTVRRPMTHWSSLMSPMRRCLP
jgi:aerobic carbon-monoxide dehydrogenase large subunit